METNSTVPFSKPNPKPTNDDSDQDNFEPLVSLSFVENGEFFVAGTADSIRLFCCSPFEQTERRDRTSDIRFSSVDLRHCLWALTAGGTHPRFPPDEVMLWCEMQGRPVARLACHAPVLSVILREEYVFAVTESITFVFDLEEFLVYRLIETAANPGGVCAVSGEYDKVALETVMAFLGKKEGEVRVERFHPLYRIEVKTVRSHRSRIACMAITTDGQFLATASVKGTLVRVFRTEDGALLQEVRRGVDRAVIHSLAFSKEADWLAVSSDKGTIHVFSLRLNSSATDDNKSEFSSNSNLSASSSITTPHSLIKGVLPKYFSSERSVAQFRLTERCKYIVAFGHKKDTIIVLGMNGSFYKCKFDLVKGGNMIELERHTFLERHKKERP